MDEVVVNGNADADAMDGHAVGELDLVEELRFFADATDADGVVVTMLSGRTFADAAAEIERLRSDVDYVHDCFATDASDSYAEIERLRSLITAWADSLDNSSSYKDHLLTVQALRKAVGR